MASGGGSHPFHLPIATPPSHSQSNSLQTPDPRSLFVSSLGGRSGGGNNVMATDTNFSITSLDQAQSFTSLEELLDVTGINSMGLGHSEMDISKELVTDCHGVNKLQQLALEVEKNSGSRGINDAVVEPASKRLCLDHSNSLTHPNQHSQNLSNIRVQPLHLPSSSSSFSSSSSTSFVKPMASPSLQQLQPPPSSIVAMPTSLPPQTTLSSFISLTPVVSLLEKRHFSVAASGNNSDCLLDALLSNHKQQQQHFSKSTGGFVDHPSKGSNHSFHDPPPYSTGVTSSISEPFPQVESLEYQQTRQVGGFSVANSMFNYHHLPEKSVRQSTSLTIVTQPQASQTSSRYPLPSILSQTSVASQAQRLNFSTTTSSHQTPIPSHGTATGTHAHNSRPAAMPVTSSVSQVADNINSNSKAVVLQLIQLYKQYQLANDQQGMARVREQINFLVSSQQKILAAQNSVINSSAPTIVNGSAKQTVSQTFPNKTGSATTSSGMAAATTATKPTSAVVPARSTTLHTQAREQQQNADRILSQLAAVVKPSQLLQQQITTATPFQASGDNGATVVCSAMSKTGSSSMAGFCHGLQGSSGNSAEPRLPILQGQGNLGIGGGDGDLVTSAAGMPWSLCHNDGAGQGLSHVPPSLLGHMSSGGSTHGLTTSTTTTLLTSGAQNQIPKNAQEDTQKAVKRIQLLMAALPDSKRPKTILELKDFVQQYSGLINKGSNFLSNYQTTPSSMCTSSSMGANSSSLPSNFSLSGRTRAQVAQALMGLPVQTQAPVGQTTTAMPVRSSLTRDAGETSRPPIPVPSAVGQRFPLSLPSLTSAMSSFLMGSDVGASKHQSSSSCGDVPVATQAHGISMSAVPSVIAETMTLRPPFGHKNPPAPMLPLTSSSTCQSASLSTSTTGIQAGVATPLPAGVTLETLGVLCRLPENDLLKLNLPLPLLSAIKVWKARQGPGKSKTPSLSNKNNIPVLIPPLPSNLPPSSSVLAATGTSISNSMVTKTGLNHHTISSSLPSPLSHSKGLLGQPNVIPSGAGFPPRSLHAFIPRPSGVTIHQAAAASSTQQHHSSQHMTRYKLKVEQQKADTDRLQALQKALQSSEEARIAFRFSAHLEKMHTQLMNPDTVTAFKSQHDILARLLPYHIYAEPEAPSAAVEKADAVFESVAQVLLSRSRGLKSRFEKIMLKTESQGGLEQTKMKYQLEQLFMEGEQERIQRENREKKEAEQIAADLSLMAGTVDSMDAEFSFGNVFSPLNSGVT